MARLIDADALIAPLKLQMESYDRIGACERAEAYRNCIWEINEAPTIDAAPVVHGQWKKRKTWACYVCSECSFEENGATNYCPNCGALMQEDE